jgi:hypothetical protein
LHGGKSGLASRLVFFWASVISCVAPRQSARRVAPFLRPRRSGHALD